MGWLQSVSDVTRGKSASIPDRLGDQEPLPEPPELFRAEPAVREAERVVRSRR
jgi:hypothetical protein